MKFFKYIFWTCYRIWFYILVGVPIIIMFPVLLISTLKESWYPYFFRLARIWAKIILFGMGFHTKVTYEQKPEKGKSYMFIANHTSMTDIMLMLKAVKNPFVFVGKKELAKIPIFGFFYKRTCILVDRSSPKSRKEVFDRAQKRLQSGLSICIFPEGGVPSEDVFLDEFKNGAFRLAIAHQIPIVPMTFPDNKKRFPYRFSGGSLGKMRATIHPFIVTKGSDLADRETIKKQARETIYNGLKAYK